MDDIQEDIAARNQIREEVRRTIGAMSPQPKKPAYKDEFTMEERTMDAKPWVDIGADTDPDKMEE